MKTSSSTASRFIIQPLSLKNQNLHFKITYLASAMCNNGPSEWDTPSKRGHSSLLFNQQGLRQKKKKSISNFFNNSSLYLITIRERNALGSRGIIYLNMEAVLGAEDPPRKPRPPRGPTQAHFWTSPTHRSVSLPVTTT